MKKNYVAYTGGTIGMTPNKNGELSNKKKEFTRFLKINSQIRKLKNEREVIIDYSEYPELIDSSDISPKHWKWIIDDISARYEDYDGFVIIHGTDTMAYTSSMVSFALENLKKPVVLTGAQKPIFNLDSDGLKNVLNSIKIASGEGKIKEVCLVFDNVIIRGCRATKISAIQPHAFSSPTSKLLGEIDGEKISTFPSRFHKIKINREFGKKELNFNDKSGVIVIRLFPAFNPEILNFLAINSSNIRGVVIEAFGQGNSPSSKEFGESIRSLTNREIIVVVISQPVHGYVQLGNYANSSVFGKNGAISGYDMTTEAAVTKLYYLFNQNLDYYRITKDFRTSLRGELSTSPKVPGMKFSHSKKLVSV